MLCHITSLVYLVIRTNHFLQRLEEDAGSMELNVAKSRGTDRKGNSLAPTGSKDPGPFQSWMRVQAGWTWGRKDPTGGTAWPGGETGVWHVGGMAEVRQGGTEGEACAP